MRATRHAHLAGHLFRMALLGMALLCTTAMAQQVRPGVKADGSLTTPAATIPYSSYASPQARAFFPKMIAAGSARRSRKAATSTTVSTALARRAWKSSTR
jgi:epsilon-lactone hydrolase